MSAPTRDQREAYERGRRDFADACERGEADGWMSQFVQIWYQEAMRDVLAALDDPAVLGMVKHEDLGEGDEPGQRIGRISVDVNAVKRHLSGGGDE